MKSVRLAVIGGSGLYELAETSEGAEHAPETPFGPPSSPVRIGEVEGRPVAFLARHGRNHERLPHEIDARANVWALKQLGVERILSVSAVGSMRENIHPRDAVIVDQFIDRAPHRPATFFGEGVVAHIAFGDPVCETLRAALAAGTEEAGGTVHGSGTYLSMEGPAFSTRAESFLYRSWGVHVIGMTNLPEAKLAREAEICYATLALVTDYDCWHEEEADVNVEDLLGNLAANQELAVRAIRRAIVKLDEDRTCPCRRALSNALLTPAERIPAAARVRLAPILARVMGERGVRLDSPG